MDGETALGFGSRLPCVLEKVTLPLRICPSVKRQLQDARGTNCQKSSRSGQRQELVEFPAGLLLEPASLPEVKEFKGSASSKIVAAAQSGRRIGSWGCG